MKISILTLFPEMFQGPFDHSIVKRAKERGLISINLINIRDFGIGKHKIVDDKPYGGGVGMVMRVDVVEKAIAHAKDPNLSSDRQKVILLDARGDVLTQKVAKSYAQLEHLILVCGHYEGVDERIEHFIDGKLSIGNFVLTGGEIPAMAVTDAVTRLVKDVLKEEATTNESFSTATDEDTTDVYLEHPQYTRPPAYKDHNVPPILMSGDHGKVHGWKKAATTKAPRS